MQDGAGNSAPVPAAPDQLWVGDLTQHMTAEGWLYLAVVIDACSRLVVGWAMGDHAVADLVVDAVNMAVWNRRPAAARGEDPRFHGFSR
jgi:putative transposase